MTTISLRKVGINNRSVNTLISFGSFLSLFTSNADRYAASLMQRLPVVIFDGFIEPRLFCISDTTVFACRLYVKITLIFSVILRREKHIKSMAYVLEKVRFDRLHFFFVISSRDKKKIDNCKIYFALTELSNSVLPNLLSVSLCIHCFRD